MDRLPEMPEPYRLQRLFAMSRIAPLAAGAGVKTKMLDYLSLGCRIVATPVAVEGLEGCPGVVVSTLDGFVATASELAKTSEPAAVLHQRVESQHRWLADYMTPGHARSMWWSILHELGLAQRSLWPLVAADPAAREPGSTA